MVAVEDYAYLPDVSGTGEVGLAWYLYLTKDRKVPFVKLLKDGEVTVNTMRDGVEQAAKRVRKGGRVWFVFIGHGAPSKDGKEGQLVGAAAQSTELDFYPNTMARTEVIAKLATRAEGVLPAVLIVDACFSGTDVAGATLIKGSQFVVSEGLATTSEQTVTLMTAGRASDIAGPLPGASQPAFSYLVLGALRGWGDQNSDGVVTAKEAVQYAYDTLQLLQTGRIQEPQQSGVDQPLTRKLTGSALERGPDLADIRVKLAETVTGDAPKVPSSLPGGLGALEDARKRRIEAEEKERVLKNLANAKHEAEVEEAWKLVLQTAGGGGPEGEKAILLFLEIYRDHPLGNPKEAIAREMLWKLGRSGAGGTKGYVLVKPGCFRMGSPDGEEGRYVDETPHEVCITRAFYLKETEVTQREWRDLMGNNPSYFSFCGDSCPVESVSWWDWPSPTLSRGGKDWIRAMH